MHNKLVCKQNRILLNKYLKYTGSKYRQTDIRFGCLLTFTLIHYSDSRDLTVTAAIFQLSINKYLHKRLKNKQPIFWNSNNKLMF